MKIFEILNESQQLIMYHLTDNPKFKLDPNRAPEDNAASIVDRSGNKGIYLAKDVEQWVNGHGYWRPFVAEIRVDRSALEHDNLGRWGGEVFIPADHFDKLSVLRLIPLDAHAREWYDTHGWLESSLGREFDTGNPIKTGMMDRPHSFGGYKYPHDVRTLPSSEVSRLKKEFRLGLKARHS